MGVTGGQRIDWVDYAKGFCIVMVVTMHSTLGVEAAAGEFGAQPDDSVGQLCRGGPGVGSGLAGPRFERGKATLSIPPQKAVEMLTVDGVFGCCIGHRDLARDDLENDDLMFRHV